MFRFFSTEDPAYLPILAYLYAHGRATRQHLEEWIVPRLPDLLASTNPLVSDLIGRIELRLAEITVGHRQERELRDELIEFLSKQVLAFDVPGAPAARSASETSQLAFAV